ncbi:hypothetical protein WJX84_001308 [Apatococcus fuscideae]|uniref:Glutaredoxin-dependent peroxiredoxin n=1 Tax=Apatococcus fuscideae TaxID=2026836 RepID=A0AAW1T3F7_9CHLO
MAPKAGDPVPDVTLYEKDPETKVSFKQLFGNKKGVLFAVPGAFTPGCSKTHLPGYVADYDKLTKAGAEVIACVSVNDPFVVTAWGESAGATGKIHMLADPFLELTKALGVVLDAEKMLGTNRSKRYSAVIEGGKFKTFNIEGDGMGLTCSLAPHIISQL